MVVMDRRKILDALKPYINASLKAPRSAIYCSPEELSVSSRGSNNYTVYGFVDSQNSYGAMLRTNFEYNVREMSDGSYIIENGGVGDNTPTARKTEQAKIKAEQEAQDFVDRIWIYGLLVGVIILVIYILSQC